MKSWKVILATLVIFATGIVTGAMVARSVWSAPSSPKARATEGGPASWLVQRPEFVRFMGQRLDLTPEQRKKIEAIMQDSQERMKPLHDLIEPLMQEELHRVKEEIQKVLTPDQWKKFEEMLKRRPHRSESSPPRPGHRSPDDVRVHPDQSPPTGHRPPAPPLSPAKPE